MSESVQHAGRAGGGGARPFRAGDALWFILKNIEEIIGCAGMCVIIAVVSVNVALRYLFSQSIAWTEEIAVIGFSCVIFLGSAAVYKRGVHVGIDFAVSLLPAKIRDALSFLTLIFLLAFNAWITWLGWIYAVESWEKPTSILFIPYFFVNLPICLGFASMTLYTVLKIRHAVREHLGQGARAETGGPA